MKTVIKRLPFAREDVIRELIPKEERKQCWFCDQVAKFRYYFEDDNYRKGYLDGDFCSIGCMKAYHELEEL